MQVESWIKIKKVLQEVLQLAPFEREFFFVNLICPLK